jgi:hypothetical protein
MLTTDSTGASKVVIINHLVRHAPIHPLYLKETEAAKDKEGAESKIAGAPRVQSEVFMLIKAMMKPRGSSRRSSQLRLNSY